MSKHTPGPWTVSYSESGMTVDTARPVRFNLTTAGTAVICNVHAHDDAEHFNGEANARLIASAPDLLEALREITSDYEARFDLDDSSTNPGIKSSILAARAAIAKATGEAA